ncbi:MAG: FAD-dependent oxidoreductase [Chloroflexi bacterium]|nr:FAD-dependent oxidoreductase [Chloroflexota bacterium]
MGGGITRTQALVIGGGATGVGIARDLAMRGVSVVLLERKSLGSGATGHCHCLLHSGARYAITDPGAAAECAEENAIIRRIAPYCIEDTGGIFVAISAAEERYGYDLLHAAERTHMPTEEASAATCRALEPSLTRETRMGVRVRDASVDPLALVAATAASARAAGADLRADSEVVKIRREGDSVRGVEVRDLTRGETYEIEADIVVNAAGPWAGRVAALAGVEVPVTPNAGVLVALARRVVSTVVHRCRPPSDGDIIVPLGDAAILGTTSRPAPTLDDIEVNEWEIEAVVAPAIEVVPIVVTTPRARAFAGARPLFGKALQDGRKASRGFAILDHARLHGVRGFLSVAGGKLTIHRLMAEHAADAVCSYLGVGVQAECRTAVEELPPLPPASEASSRADGALRLA